MDRLAIQKCIPCQIGAPTLTRAEIDKYLREVFDWKYESEPDRIMRDFRFDSFKEALDFVNKVGEEAEKEGHHPDIFLHDFKNVEITLWTHKINGLHKNDFIMASKIDSITQ